MELFDLTGNVAIISGSSRGIGSSGQTSIPARMCPLAAAASNSGTALR